MKHFIVAVVAVLLFAGNAKSQTPGSNQFKKDFLDEINHIRQKGCSCGLTRMPPVAPLTWNDMLAKAALGHAKDMDNKNYFSHDSKDGRSVFNRIENAGYIHNGFKSFVVGENIAQGQQSIAEVMAGWFKSEGHCHNLMNADFKEIGVAEYNTYWVQDFGGREEFSAEVQKMIKSGRYKIIQHSRPAQ